MKEKEMIDIFEKILYDSWDWKSGDRHLATKLIEAGLKAGMLPPDAMPAWQSIGERETKDAIWVKSRWRWEDGE